jgi:hypothetical protein
MTAFGFLLLLTGNLVRARDFYQLLLREFQLSEQQGTICCLNLSVKRDSDCFGFCFPQLSDSLAQL